MEVARGMDVVHTSNRWIAVTLGILALIAGALAIIMPFISGVILTDVFGVILIVGAVVHLVNSIRFHISAWSVVLGIIVSFLYAITGIFLLSNPVVGLFTLTVVLGSLYTVVGLYRIATNLDFAGDASKGWALAGGILTLILGIWILAALPVSMLWALGIIIGVDLIFFGAALLSGYTSERATGHTGRFATNM